MSGPLDGTLVLDLSRVLAGPWASQALADQGARVIKVERPGQGDDTRSWGPPYLESGENKESAYFLSANRGKESIAIDFKDPRGQSILRTLAKKADILIAAVGVANLVRGDWVKKDSIIIDVGINKVGEKIVGDVNFKEVKDKVKAITPVPGGVGPMTIACLLKNTLECFKGR